MALRAFLLLALILIGLTALGGSPPAGVPLSPGGAAPPAAVVPLPPGTTVRSAGTVSAYRVELRQGQFLHVAAEQLGMDVALVLRGPAGDELLTVDSPNSQWGPENLYCVAPRTGGYVVEARKRNALPGGRFELRLDLPHPAAPATPAETAHAAACLETSAGDRLAQGDGADRYEALHHLREAARIWHSLAETESEAFAEAKLGGLWWRLGAVRQALAHREKALALLQALGRGHALPALFNDLATSYASLGDDERARAAYEDALLASRRRGDRREESMVLLGLANLERRAGFTWSALERLRQTLAGCREIADGCAADALLSLGTSETQLGQLDVARADLSAAAETYRKLSNVRGEGLATMELGWARLLAGDAAAARADLTLALEMEQRVGNHLGEAVVLDRLGSLDRDRGDARSAIIHYRRALAIFGARDRPDATRTLSNLSEALTAAGYAAAGLQAADVALARLRSAPAEPASEAYARFRRAHAERSLGRLRAARDDMELGLARLEAIREKAASSALRQSYLGSVHDEYEALIDIDMDLHRLQPEAGYDRDAVAVAERGAARNLVDLLASPELPGGGGAGSPRSRLRELDERIEREEAMPPGASAAAEPDPAKLARIQELLAARQQILVEARGVAGGAAARTHLLLADDIQRQVLDPGTVLLVYSLGERRSFVWALTTGRLRWAPLPPRSQIEDAVRRQHALLARSGSPDLARQAQLTGHALSDLLLQPVAEALAGRRIAVMPDGALFYLPFATLPDPAGSGDLLATHEVVIVPSASALAAIRQRAATRPPAPRQVAVVADPRVEAEAPAAGAPAATRGASVPLGPPALSATLPVARSERDLGLQRLAPLPYARREAEDIQTLAPPPLGFVAVGADASLALVRSGFLSAFGILQFAGHALIHPSAPELSGLVLAATDAQGRPQPGFLQSFAISELHLPAELVVLSACSTALGQEVRGEGLLGLTQSFFLAGATRIVVSLWDVDDHATEILMQRFYTAMLRRHLPPAAALREAQLSLRADPRWAAPYYWAGFELQGDWRALPGGGVQPFP